MSVAGRQPINVTPSTVTINHPADRDKSIVERREETPQTASTFPLLYTYFKSAFRKNRRFSGNAQRAVSRPRFDDASGAAGTVQSCAAQQPQYDSYALSMRVGYLFFPRERETE